MKKKKKVQFRTHILRLGNDGVYLKYCKPCCQANSAIHVAKTEKKQINVVQPLNFLLKKWVVYAEVKVWKCFDMASNLTWYTCFPWCPGTN